MAERSERRGFRLFFAIALVIGIGFLIPGLAFAQECIQNPYGISTPWQEVTMTVLMLSFLPLVLLGLFRPRLAAILFCSGAALCVVQVIGIKGSTGDGFAGGLVGAVILLGLPMLGTGLLFRYFAPSEPRTRSIVSR